MEQGKVQKILPVNSKVKDTFFKTVYRSNERLKGLVQFLLGIPDGEVCIKTCVPLCLEAGKMICLSYMMISSI